MMKPADYCISSVCYNNTHSRILKARIHTVEGGVTGAAIEWTRKDISDAPVNNKTFITVLQGLEGLYKMKDIYMITVNGVKYIRTDAASKASDILEDIPEFKSL